jgi:hypothetical protein
MKLTRMPFIVTSALIKDHPIVFASAEFCPLTGYQQQG